MLAFSAILVFIATLVGAGVVLLVGWLALQRIRASSLTADAVDTQPEPSALLRDESISTISLWGSLLSRFDFIEKLRQNIQQAGLSWSVGRFTMLMLLCGSIVFAVLLKQDWAPLWVAIASAWMAALLPYLYILRRRKKRFLKFEEQFPDALDSLARALRAGHPFAVGMEVLAAECEEPVATEMRKTAADGNLGTSWGQALENLGRRVPLLEVNMFVSAVQLQTRTGGKLNEILANLSENMRESISLKGEVRAIAAHGRMTGMILTILPIGIAIMMMIVNPSYLYVLIAYPYGGYMIGAAIGCLILAHFVISRIVDIKI